MKIITDEVKNVEDVVSKIFEEFEKENYPKNDFYNIHSEELMIQVFNYLSEKNISKNSMFLIENNQLVPVAQVKIEDVKKFLNDKPLEEKTREIMKILKKEISFETFQTIVATAKYILNKFDENK